MRRTSLRLPPLLAASTACVVLGALAGGLTGCSKPLLAPTDERTPYDRYDYIRGQHAPQYIENEYGRRQPNLRGRLAPKS